MTTSLEPVLQIRKRRVDAAHAKVRECQAQVNSEIERKAQAEQELERFQQQRPQLETELFDALKGKSLHRDDFDHYHQQLRQLGEQEKQFKSKIDAVVKDIQRAEKALATARKAHDEIVRAVQKLEEFVAQEKEEQRRLAGDSEEMEMEDFLLSRRHRQSQEES